MCQDLWALLRERLRGFDVQALPAEGHRHAAVAVTVTEGPGRRRGRSAPVRRVERGAGAAARQARARLSSHAGRWACRVAASARATPEEAALRELREEVGLALDVAAVLGRLERLLPPVRAIWVHAGSGLGRRQRGA